MFVRKINKIHFKFETVKTSWGFKTLNLYLLLNKTEDFTHKRVFLFEFSLFFLKKEQHDTVEG